MVHLGELIEPLQPLFAFLLKQSVRRFSPKITQYTKHWQYWNVIMWNWFLGMQLELDGTDKTSQLELRA